MTEFTSRSVLETERFAAQCAVKLRAGDVLACRGGVLFIEWSENAAGELPPETICVCFERIDDDTRLIMLEGGPF